MFVRVWPCRISVVSFPTTVRVYHLTPFLVLCSLGVGNEILAMRENLFSSPRVIFVPRHEKDDDVRGDDDDESRKDDANNDAR